ncbi:MAG TPA: hypothetical protein ENN90_05405 [Mariniphaga anaerophila]|uniref:Uncharacterized protein n=1 Tax=Mariniphaga anaerophila TaxID=1484053 RepID=A0A831LQZ4_9BACT|nr:hypothetical protein [Mariniphaga anaerophila]
MKAIVLFSSFFFFLGLKIGNIIDLPGKARVAVEVGVTEKIKQSAPVKSFQMLRESGEETEKHGVKSLEATENSAESNNKTEE